MTMQELAVTMTVRRPREDVGIIDIRGDVNAACEGVLMDAYREASAGQPRTIILNFGDLDYMNSAGIGVLGTLLVRVRRQQQRLLAYGLNDHYRQIFALTRLDEAIGIHDAEADALAVA